MAHEGLRGLACAADSDVAAGNEMGERAVGEDDDRLGRRDRELLRRDRLERVAEDVRVVEPDVREEDDACAQDVRRVEAAAEPGFDDGNVDLRVGEGGERGGGHDLELRGVEPLRRRPDSRDGLLEVRLGAVEPDPLAPARDVRGDRRADRQALRRAAAARS